MRNPDNPFAQTILKEAAQAISDRSGHCLTGCADADEDGGVLWAMNNPDNPIAQDILRTTAQAIQENSGAGQLGGPSDNPENPPVGDDASDTALAQIEFIISGGGVVDPPEETSGGTVPDTPETGQPPTTGGNPVSADNLTIHSLQGGQMMGGEPEDPDDPEDGLGEVQIDQGKLRSGVTR